MIQKKYIVLVLVVAVIVLLVVFKDMIPENASYQAVFLTNSQVYFGKMSTLNGQFSTLTDVYYLQVPPAADSKGDVPGGPQLIKLGSELHSPKDELVINRDHILFVQELRPESQVVQAIKNFKNPPAQN